MGQRRYQTDGFIPIVAPPARIHRKAAVVNIVKGDALHDDGDGYATNATLLFAATFLGFAAANCNNSAGSAGALSVEIYPLDMTTRYIVPVAANALITQTVVGTYCNLSGNDDIAINVNPTEGLAFFVEDIDASAEAIVANAYGYAIGVMRVVGTQT